MFRDRERGVHSDQVGLRLYKLICVPDTRGPAQEKSAGRERCICSEHSDQVGFPLENERRVCLPVEKFGPRGDGGQQ